MWRSLVIICKSVATTAGRRRCSAPGGFWLVLLACAVPGLAQKPAVSGEVADDSGAVVAHAEVKLTNHQNKWSRVVTTDDAGRFALIAVAPGEYTVVVEAGGFARYERTAVTVPANQTLTLNITLKVETVAQSVTVRVSDEPPLLQVPDVSKTGH